VWSGVSWLGIGCSGVDWSELARDRLQWPSLVNTVINSGVP
jgi:hypothetical protein